MIRKHVQAILCLLGSLILGSCRATTEAEVEPLAINELCPRSGKPVQPDSLTTYRGHVVGFCNTHCRDDFAAHVAERPQDRQAFDRRIAELEAR